MHLFAPTIRIPSVLCIQPRTLLGSSNSFQGRHFTDVLLQLSENRESKDQTEDNRSSRRKREADKQKDREGEDVCACVLEGLSLNSRIRAQRIKQSQYDRQWELSKRSSLRKATSPTADVFLGEFLWPSVCHPIQGVDKTYDLSPLPVPLAPPLIEVRLLN